MNFKTTVKWKGCCEFTYKNPNLDALTALNNEKAKMLTKQGCGKSGTNV